MNHNPTLKILIFALFIGVFSPSFAQRVVKDFNDEWVFRAPGIFLTTKRLSEREADVSLRAVLTNMADHPRQVTLRWTVRGEGRTA